MSRSLPVVLAVAIIVWRAGPVSGKSCVGVVFPEETYVQTGPLMLNGLGLRERALFRIGVYVAALYVAQKSTDAHTILTSHTPKQLVLRFLRTVEGADLKQAWEEGFADNAKAQLPALKERIEQLNGWIVTLKRGQEMTFTYKPGVGIEVDVNGTVQGTVEGEDFATAFFAIWLGARPLNRSVKAGLLGADCGAMTRGFGSR